MIETLLAEARKIADLRNGEVLTFLFDSLGETGPKKRCKFCQYKEDYVDCKILAKTAKRNWRQSGIPCPLEQYALAMRRYVPDENREEQQVRELFKVAWEFRKRMRQEGQCSCPASLLSPKGNEHVRRSKHWYIRD